MHNVTAIILSAAGDYPCPCSIDNICNHVNNHAVCIETLASYKVDGCLGAYATCAEIEDYAIVAGLACLLNLIYLSVSYLILK